MSHSYERDMTGLMESRLPSAAVMLLRDIGLIADERKTGAFVVGGLVRDLFMGVPNCDLDIVIEEPVEPFAAQCAERLGGQVKTHTRFGTATLLLGDRRKVDLASARSEAYARPGALPVVRRGTIREDLRRRDFTINAMAIRINGRGFGTLLDLHSGKDDIGNGVLRVLHDRSFEDDPTRILRGVRLSARHGFAFGPATEQLLKSAVARGAISTVSGERVRSELVSILREPKPWGPVEQLASRGILRAIETDWQLPPETRRTFGRVGEIWRSGVCGDAAAEAGASARQELWRAYLVAMLAPVAVEKRRALVEHLACDGLTRRTVNDLESLEREDLGLLASPGEVPRSSIRRSLERYDQGALILAMARTEDESVFRRTALYLSELRHARTGLSGKQLAGLGVPEGKRIGEILRALLDARLDGLVTTLEEETALAKRMAADLDR